MSDEFILGGFYAFHLLVVNVYYSAASILQETSYIYVEKLDEFLCILWIFAIGDQFQYLCYAICFPVERYQVVF